MNTLNDFILGLHADTPDPRREEYFDELRADIGESGFIWAEHKVAARFAMILIVLSVWLAIYSVAVMVGWL